MGPFSFLVGILIFLCVRSPCQILEPTTTPSGILSRKAEECGYMAGGAWLYGRKRAVICQEEHGNMAGGARLYGEEHGYMVQ